MEALRYYHNPKCSKSRQGLALLEAKGATLEIIEYLKDAPTLEQLETLAEALGEGWRAMVRSSEAAYAAAGLDANSLRSDVLAAVAEQPSLLQRPIAVRGGRVILGRPPEDMLAILND